MGTQGTTTGSDLKARMCALRDELEATYETRGSHAMFGEAARIALEFGVTERWQLVFTVISLGEDLDDLSVMASAVSSYAAGPETLEKHPAPEGIRPEQRAAYIAAHLMGDLTGWGGLRAIPEGCLENPALVADFFGDGVSDDEPVAEGVTA